MPDNFANHASGLNSPFTGGAIITPDDNNDLATEARGLVMGSAGTISFVTKDGQTITAFPVLQGMELTFRVKRVKSTGTTVTSILAGW